MPIRIPEGTLKESLADLAWLDIQGYSITIPHKEAILPLLAKHDGAVDMTGACNTAVNREGKLHGFNSDYRAAIGSMEAALGGPGIGDISPLMDKQALILGAGGAARSIAFGLTRRGAGVTITNRHDERATKLAEEVGCRSTPWGMRAAQLCDILINCTPVGMHPEVNESPVPQAAFKPGMIAFDTVYHPESTLFLKNARDHSSITITGVDMFVRQAALQFYHFTGKEPPLDLMRGIVRRKLNPARAEVPDRGPRAPGRRMSTPEAPRRGADLEGRGDGLALVGYRGTGKSSVGRRAALALGLPFADADDEAEARAGRSIAAIFAESGEAAFRDLEAETLRELASGPPLVLATGGGGVLLAENRQALRRLGLVVWLDADPETLVARLVDDPRGRPALTAAGTLGEVAAVALARRPLYRQVADHRIDTTGRPVEEVAGEVARLHRAWTDRGGPRP